MATSVLEVQIVGGLENGFSGAAVDLQGVVSAVQV